MRAYDDRRTTLDPGLTALALRGRRDATRFPFLHGVMPPRRWWRLGTGLLAAGLAAWRDRGRGRPGADAPPPRG
jgi:hypothetical protein